MINKLHIFIDESGDLGKHGSKYFTIAALCTKNPKKIENCIKRIRIRKLKKKYKRLSEIKANNSSNKIRLYVLKKLMQSDCEFNIITIAKNEVRDYLYDKKHKLYNYVMGILFEKINLYSSKNIEVHIDKKDSNQLLKEDINQYIKKKIQERKLLFNIDIKHLESHLSKGLQAVDFVAWSANRKYSFGDDSFYNIIEPKSSFKKLWKK